MIAVLIAIAPLMVQKTEWSAPVGGLIGRIEAVRKGAKDGTPKLIPYLVLKNVTDSLGTVDVYLSKSNLALRLVDAKGVEIQSTLNGLNGRNGFVPNPFWLMIPFDSTITINASLSGYFSREKGELLLETESAFLFIPKNYRGRAFLTGTFSVKNAPPEPRGLRWEGELSLPRIEVWDGKRITVRASD